MKITKFLWPRDQQRVRDALSQLPIKLGTWFTITITPHDPGTDEQRGYYFANVVRRIAQETGNSETAVHLHLKSKFIPRASYEFNGVKYEGDPTTTTLIKDEWSTYITQCEAWAAEEGYL